MDIQKVKALIALAAESGLAEFEYEENDCRLRLTRGDAGPVVKGLVTSACVAPASTIHETVAVAPAIAVAPPPTQVLKSPTFGVFCLTPAANEPPFVQVGDAVKKGQKICMLEAMKQFHAVNADRDGKIAAILAENGQEVDAGQPLFRFEP